ncbi:MAG: hypothetical protein AAF307_02360 [Pseudomonadota bacterium]
MTFFADRPSQQRPRLTAWLSLEGLQGFLLDSRDQPPDFVETAGSTLAQALTLPILDTREIEVSGRAITALEVLVPVVTSALQDWSALNEAADQKPQAVVLLDESGSAARFMGQLKSNLARALSRTESSSVEITLISFDADGDAATMRPTTLLQALLDVPRTMGPRSLADQFDALDQDAPRSIVVLSGGDVRLPPHPVLVGAQHLVVANVTPELDRELSGSVAALDATETRYFPFQETSATALLDQMAQYPAFEASRAKRQSALKAFEAAHAAAGFISMLPQVADADAARAGLNAPRDDGGAWVAFRAWVIFNPLLMTRP